VCWPSSFTFCKKCSQMSEFLATDPEVRVQFPVLPGYLRSSGSGTGSTQPHELLERKSSSSGLENRDYGCRDMPRLPRNTIYPEKLD
jgi:hypothetical protein